MSELDESITEIQSNETLNTTQATHNTENAQENNKLLEVSIDTDNMNVDKQNSGSSSGSIEQSPVNENESSTPSGSCNNNTNNNTTNETNSNNNNNPNNNNTAQPSTPLASDSPSNSNNNSPSKPKTYSVKDIGVSYEKNPRFRKTMEDEHVILDRFNNEDTTGYYAIYDGHGGRGAVEFTAKYLHNILLEQMKKHPDNMLKAISEAYTITDTQMEKENVLFSGTTAISSLIRFNQVGEKWLYTANAGDARAVLAEDGKGVRLSHDHKGSDPQETQRIMDAGGFVVNNRVNGILAVTRSLGDHSMKEYVVGTPYTTEVKLDSRHTHLILACDGLWDVTSDQDAVDLIVNETDAQKMSEKLLLHALKHGSTDNISIIVIIL